MISNLKSQISDLKSQISDLRERAAPWLAGDGPDAMIAVCCQCNLLRNLADFCFPAACTEDERRAVEERVLNALDQAGLLEEGQYCSISSLDLRETLFLAERRLVPFELVLSRGGVYISEDQCTSIAVNGADHICLSVLGSGLAFRDLWSKLNFLDDRLADALGYAFDKRFGYLTSSLRNVGTGLLGSVILHLPALTAFNSVAMVAQNARERRHALYGLKSTIIAPGPANREAGAGDPRLRIGVPGVTLVESHGSEAFYNDLSESLYGDISEAQGDLYVLTNLRTLGESEEEVLFHLRHAATEIIRREKAAREEFASKEHRRLEDRVARALGVARSARLLGFTEAVSLLSSLRLGLDTGLLQGFTLPQLNELLLVSQSAHIKMKAGQDCDEWMMGVERADLFRSRFAENREG